MQGFGYDGITRNGTASYAQDPGGSGSPSGACLAFKSELSLGAALAHTEAKLQPGQTLTVVALGSSSTTGFGTFGSGGAFPDMKKQELLRLQPSARIELINSGRIMDNLPGNIARLDNDVLRHKPDLVVWQIGTKDVVWRGIADNAKEILSDAVKRLKAANTDVVLLDLQYAPLVLAGH
jgi:acyl-CoA thioesterase I